MRKGKTAGKTATERIRLDRRNRTITLTIGGEFYDDLETAAKRLNTVEWCKGNTPASVFREFVWRLMGESIMCHSTLVGTIADCIDTGIHFNDDSLEARLFRRDNPADRERREEVRTALMQK